MILSQTPQPPPQGLPEWVPPFLAVMALLVVAAALLMPLVRAWARRIEGRGAEAGVLDELAHLRERVAELEMSGAHVAELEERLDFAERLLAQRSEMAQLPQSGTSAQ